jgi:hypothetical protein
MLKRDVAVVLVSVFGLWLATRSAGPTAVRFRKAWHSSAMLDSALVVEDGDSADAAGNADPAAELSSPVARAAAAAARLRAELGRGQLHAHLPRPVVADLNGDGSLEVLVATHDYGLRLLRPEPPSALLSSSREGFAPAREVAAASLLPLSSSSSSDSGAAHHHNNNNDKEDEPFDEDDWAPAALAVGYLDPPPEALVAAPRKMVAAVVTRGWRVLVFDHNLKLLWSARPAREAARALGHGYSLHEVAVAVLPAPVRKGDRGLVVVGGSAVRGSSISVGGDIAGLIDAEERREALEAGGTAAAATASSNTSSSSELPLLTRHFSYFAYEGARGHLRWTHEQDDPLPPGEGRIGHPASDAAASAGAPTPEAADAAATGTLKPQHAPLHRLLRSSSGGGDGRAAASSSSTSGGSSRGGFHRHGADAHTAASDASIPPPSCRDYRESALHHGLPHHWLSTSDTRLEPALFLRHGDGRALSGPEHESGEYYRYGGWMGEPTAQQKRRAAGGLRHPSSSSSGGGGGGGGLGGWASRLLFGHGSGGGDHGGSSSRAFVGNDEAFYAQGAQGAASSKEKGRATLTDQAHAGAAARHGGGASTAASPGGDAAKGQGRGRGRLPRANALVAHVEGGVEVMHLYSGKPVCRMTLPGGHVVHADLNGDGVVESVAAPPGADAFSGEDGGFAGSGGGGVGGGGGGAAATGPCVASATTGAPNRRLLWSLDLCAQRHPSLEGGGAWMEAQLLEGEEMGGSRAHGSSSIGSSGGAPAPRAFAAPAFLPLPRAGDGAYSRLRGQHGLAAFFGSDGVVTGVSARGETLFVEHTLCTWGPPWRADGGEEDEEEEEQEERRAAEGVEAALRREMGVGDGEEIDPAHRAFVSSYHDELEGKKKGGSMGSKKKKRKRASSLPSPEDSADLLLLPENFDEHAPAMPTLAALPLRTGAVPTALLALGARHGVVLSERGHELDRLVLPHPPVHEAVLADFDGDGLTDLIVVTANGAYGYAQRHASAGGGGLALGSLLAALMVALGLVWWGSVSPPLLVVPGGGGGGGGGGGSTTTAKQRAEAAAMRRAALKARRSTHWED